MKDNNPKQIMNVLDEFKILLESNDEMKVFYILNGFNDMDPMSNSIFFREVQIYILATNRFSPLPL